MSVSVTEGTRDTIRILGLYQRDERLSWAGRRV